MRRTNMLLSSLVRSSTLRYARHAKSPRYLVQAELRQQYASLTTVETPHLEKNFNETTDSQQKHLHDKNDILLKVRSGSLCVRVWFGVVPSLEVYTFLFTLLVEGV